MMLDRQDPQVLAREFPSLILAINKLINKQEKNWGYFQVQKQVDFYSLSIPSIASLKLYQNTKTHVYKGYWRNFNSSILPDIKDKAEKPDIYIKKKRKQIRDSKQLNSLKKQRIFEINYRHNTCSEINQINKVLIEYICEHIKANISYSPGEEIMPLVLVAEEI